MANNPYPGITPEENRKILKPKTPEELQADVAQIPTEGYGEAGQQAGLRAGQNPANPDLLGFIPSTDLTRNIFNTLNAYPTGGGLRATSKAAGTLSTIGSKIAPPVIMRGGEAITDLDKASRVGNAIIQTGVNTGRAATVAKTAATLPTLAAASNAVAQPAVATGPGATQADVRRIDNALDPSRADIPAGLPAGVTRVGNTYSNTDDQTMNRVSSLPFAEGLKRQMDANTYRQQMLDNMAATGINSDGTMGTSAGLRGIVSTTKGNFRGAVNEQEFKDDRARYLAEQAMRSPKSAAVGAKLLESQQDLETKRDISKESLRSADIQARERNTVLDKIAERQNMATLRGQDITAGTARERLGYDAAKDSRDYQLNVAKYGADQADKIRDDRIKSEDALTKRLGSLYPGADGKPDAALVAQHLQNLNARVGDTIAKLEAIPKDSPGYAQAQTQIKALRTEGAMGMDDRTLQETLAQGQMQNIVNQTATGSLIPWGTARGRASGPEGYKIREARQGLFGTDYVLENGTVVPARKLREMNIEPLMGLRR